MTELWVRKPKLTFTFYYCDLGQKELPQPPFLSSVKRKDSNRYTIGTYWNQEDKRHEWQCSFHVSRPLRTSPMANPLPLGECAHILLRIYLPWEAARLSSSTLHVSALLLKHWGYWRASITLEGFLPLRLRVPGRRHGSHSSYCL